VRIAPIALFAAFSLPLGCASAEKKPDATPAAETAEKASDAKAEDKKLVVDKLPEDVGLPRTGPLYFETDSDVLSDRSREQLGQIANYMNAEKGARITIEGHADLRGSGEYNLSLGDRRAKVARDYLLRLGVDEARVGVLSYGEERPAAEGDDENAWSKNRRDEFRFILDGGA
jgi:peptidoglycan-associated lipoprotein